MRPCFHLVVGVVVVLSSLATPPTARAEAAPEPALTEGELEIDRLMTSWSELLEQTIAVKEIAGLAVAAADSTREQLEARLKSLLTKKRSNREWDAYWSSQEALVGRLLALYEQLAPVAGEGPLDAKVVRVEAQRAAAAEALRAAERTAGALADTIKAGESALGAALEAAREQVPELEAAVERRLAAFTAASEPVGRLEAAGARAEAALAKAQAARDAASEALAAARDEARTARDLVAFLEPFLAGGDPAGALPAGADEETRRRVTALREAREAQVKAETALAEARAADARADEAEARARAQQRGFRARRPALTAWHALAGDKTENQDAYLTAIDDEIASAEERLRGLAAVAAEEPAESAANVCDQERRADESPFEHYNACVRAAKEEIRAEQAKLADLAAEELMNSRSVKSVETLAAAQARDVELGKRELAIATAEEARGAAEGETERWRDLWRMQRERALAKKEQLADALRTTKETRRTLTVNEAFFTSEKASVTARIEQLEALLDESSSPQRFLGALAESAWIFIKNAWVVPVYLLGALLVLRLLRRLEKRVVARATVDAATKDDVQRVETLAVVVRSGLQLVVFIATGLLCLEAIGVDTGPILGGAAIFGLAISFGSQSLVKDFVTGFFILLENQFSVGDIIEANGNSGTVEAITMRRTVLRDLQGRVHHVPNGSITSVTNSTQGWSRVLIHLGVAYNSDLDQVEAVVNRVGDELKADPAWADRLAEPPRYIGLVSFGDSALNVRIMFQTTIFEQWAAEREFNKRLKIAFDAEGIGIPFPQRDLHLIDATPLRLTDATAGGRDEGGAAGGGAATE